MKSRTLPIPKRILRHAGGAALFAAILPVSAEVEFNRDIRPILSENCFQCHGPDPGSRKEDLRLDTKEGFFASTADRGPTVVAGKPDESPMFQRVGSDDPDEIMPPPESHKQLKPEEKELLRQWIAQGAVWQPHWSFLAPTRPPVPTALSDPAWVRNPIDAFVLAKLDKAGLKPAPEAGRRSLARRLSLDLTGLPPSVADLEVVVNDPSPEWEKKFTRHRIDSPQWGEHRARYWLDAARYADTHGMHFDNYREMWPYRDWVIKAFNTNLPYDQFVVDQIAGDLLPNPTLDQQIATGFHRCNITTNEGGTIVEENLANYARDRVETTSWVFLGLTANCAVCHDHKFDPITTRDFYAMSAFFRNTTQPGLDGNVKDSTPSIAVPLPEDRARWEALPGDIATARAALEKRRAEAAPEFQNKLATVKPGSVRDVVKQDQVVFHALLNDAGALPVNAKPVGTIQWTPDGKLGPAPQLKAGASFDLGDLADFEKDEAFSYGAWVRPTSDKGVGSVVARMDQKDGYRGWDLFRSDGNFVAHLVNKWPENALKVSTTNAPIKPGQWQHVFVTYDGSGKPAGVKIYLDGSPAPMKTDNDSLTETIRAKTPLRIGQRSESEAFEGAAQDVRIYGRVLDADEVKAIATSGPFKALLAVPADKRTPEQEKALFEQYLAAYDDAFRTITGQLAALESELAAMNARSAITHVQAERMDAAPMAKILTRGQYDQPGEEVEPAVFHALHPLPEGAPKNRLGLAEWLVAAENPLTARVTVNRFWQEIFGIGLVKSAEDFGIMGEIPPNQALLDWLAVEFRESGWNVRHLFELIVDSATYRQSNAITEEKLALDPENRLLSRGPRFRMDAEMVRDYALAASGLLVEHVGGPSVKPYQPDGVWEAVAMPESNTRNYVVDSGDALHRRSLYTFLKRSAPPASLDIFNATSRETSCLRRERTNTPLQALVTLNDTQFFEAARRLAENAMREGMGAPPQVLEAMSLRVLGRLLRPEETKLVLANREEFATYYAAHPEEAKAAITVGASVAEATLDPPQLAAWTMTANQLLNLDETLNK
jgi:hypothetical protein